MLIDNNDIHDIKALLNKNKRELYGLHLAPLRNKKNSIDSKGLFGKKMDGEDQLAVLIDFFKFLIRHRMYKYLYQHEMLRLYYYMFFLLTR